MTAYKDGVVRCQEPPQGWMGNRIAFLGSDERGEVWSLSDSGLLTRVRDGLILKPEPGLAAGLYEMACSKSGKIWVTSAGWIYELKGDSLSHIANPLGVEWFQGIGAASDGGLWAISNNRLYKLLGSEWTKIPGDLPINGAAVHNLVETRSKFLVGTTTQLGAFFYPLQDPTSGFVLDKDSEISSNWIRTVCEDMEGNLWLGAGSNGLFKVSQTKFRQVVAPDGWKGATVLTAMPSDENGFWIGTEGAGIYKLSSEGKWSDFGIRSGLNNLYVWSLAQTKDGALYAGTWGDGIFKLNDTGFSKSQGLARLKTPVPALLGSRRGGLWVGSRSGLGYFDGEAISWIQSDESSRIRDVRTLLETDKGVLWFGSNGDGLGRLEDGSVHQYTEKDGLVSNFVQCMYLDDNGALWIGTKSKAICRFKNGRFSSVDTAKGLIDDNICAILGDGNGYLWMSSHGGIFRVNMTLLDSCADGRIPRVECISYGIDDGLPSMVATGSLQPNAFKTKDGRLVFATERGLAIVNPAAIKPNPLPPPVVIESVRVDDTLINVENAFSGPLVLEPGQRRIEFTYTGLSFTAPERVRFKRRLEGLESQWIDARGERTALYSYIPPGKYVFRVIASNNNNVWNTEGCSLAVVVLPYFWETLWFKLLSLLFLLISSGAIIRALVRKRMQRKLFELERLNAIEMERSRIARDMHDDLGAQLTRITMLSETTFKDLGDPAKTGSGLRKIYDTARSVTGPMDEIVGAVNPKHDSRHSLVTYFENFAHEVLEAAGIRCRLDLPVEFPSWRPSSEVRHNLFLAFKEALNNAVRHSGADTVTVALEVGKDDCRLTVSDNGRGLRNEPQENEVSREQGRVASGNGIANMSERMSRIGGTCEVRNLPGEGCVVSFIVPVHLSEST